MNKKERMKKIEELDSLGSGDNESDHVNAESILLECVHPDIREAYTRARKRIGFWYA